MRITCPNCQAAYNVPEAKLIGRRAVRCSRCGTDWTPEINPPEDVPEPHRLDNLEQAEPPPASEPELPKAPAPQFRPSAREFTAMERLTRATEPPKPSISLKVAWIMSLALVALMLLSAVIFRADIMRAWPPSTRAYAALGLADTGK